MNSQEKKKCLYKYYEVSAMLWGYRTLLSGNLVENENCQISILHTWREELELEFCFSSHLCQLWLIRD